MNRRSWSRAALIGLLSAGPLVGVAQPAWAEGFAAGTSVEVSVTGLPEDRYWQACVITSNQLASGGYGVRCGLGDYFVKAAWVRAPKAAAPAPGPVAAAPAPVAAPPAPVAAAPAPVAAPPPAPVAANPVAPAGQYAIGQRVLATPFGLLRDESYRKCTITSAQPDPNVGTMYGVTCDDPKGGASNDYKVRPAWIKLGNAGPAPKTPPCPFTVPPDVASTRPSVALFKRRIYDVLAIQGAGRRIGVTYESFRQGATFKNRKDILGYAQGAPDGATIYPVKTTLLLCDEYDSAILRWRYEEKYNCFRNEFAEWRCELSASRTLEQTRIPKP